MRVPKSQSQLSAENRSGRWLPPHPGASLGSLLAEPEAMPPPATPHFGFFSHRGFESSCWSLTEASNSQPHLPTGTGEEVAAAARAGGWQVR